MPIYYSSKRKRALERTVKTNGGPAVLPVNRASLMEEALRRELLRSDRRRVSLLIGVLGLLLALVLAMRFAPGLISANIRSGVESSVWGLAIILAGYLVYEAVVRRWLGRLLDQGKSQASWWPYVNVAIEVSLPTLVLAVLTVAVGGLPALAGAVPFVYLLLILTFVLSLNFGLCVFAGVVSCVEFLVVNLLLLRVDSAASDPALPVLSMLVSPHQYVAKAFFLLTAG